MDPIIIVLFAVFFFAVIVLGPIFGAEDRPDFLRPDRPKARHMVRGWNSPESWR